MTQRFVFDEFGYHVSDIGAARRALRSVPGVPDATYVVERARGMRSVFVFDALFAALNDLAPSSEWMPRAAELAPAMMDRAWVTPLEAVTRWNVAPEAYRWEPVRFRSDMGRHARQFAVIRHQALDAILPGVYDMADTQRHTAMARLLVGEAIPGDGEFSYRGQAMTALGSFDPSTLPSPPAVIPLMRPVAGARWMSACPWRPGFDLLPEDGYGRIRDLGELADDRIAAARSFLGDLTSSGDGVRRLWGRLRAVGLDHLARLGTRLAHSLDLDADDEGAIAEMRQTVSTGLHTLPPAAIGGLLVQFRDETDGRDTLFDVSPTFPEWLLQVAALEAAGASQSVRDHVMTGPWLLIGLLAGMAPRDAVDYAAPMQSWCAAVNDMAARAIRVMTFLGREDGHALRGGPILTLEDLMRIGRKTNAGVMA